MSDTEPTLQDILDNPDIELPDDPEAIEALTRQMAGEDEIAYGTDTTDPDAGDQADDDDKAAEQAAAEKAAADAAIVEKAATGDKPDGDEEQKGDIESRKGGHVIPYHVLEGSRAEVQRLTEENERQAAEAAELREKLAAAGNGEEEDAGKDKPADKPVTPEGEFERIYGVSVADFEEEYGETQKTMFLNQVTENLTLKQELGEVKESVAVQGQQAEADSKQSLQDAIDANPTLSDIQQNDGAKWAAAISMNAYLLEFNKEYEGKSHIERMAFIAEQIAPSKAPPPKDSELSAEEKAALVKANLKTGKAPTSTTDFPGSGDDIDVSEMDRLDEMSPAELDRLMENPVTAAKVLANL